MNKEIKEKIKSLKKDIKCMRLLIKAYKKRDFISMYQRDVDYLLMKIDLIRGKRNVEQ